MILRSGLIGLTLSLGMASAGALEFEAGESVVIDHPTSADVTGFGGRVTIAAPVDGDAVLAGGWVSVGNSVGRSLYAAGGRLTLGGTVGRSARLAGGRVRIDKGARIGDNLALAGGEITLTGTVGGNVKAAGGRIIIDGTVGGDVDATTGHLEVGPNARIGGRLRYAGEDAVIDPAAQVTGGVDRLRGGFTWHRDSIDDDSGVVEVAPPHRRHGWIWTAGLVVIAALLAAASPNFYGRVTGTVRSRFGGSLLAGLVALVAIPIVIVILAVTIIGIPLALLVAVAYLVLLCAGYVLAAAATGDWALSRLRPIHATSPGWRVIAAMIGMLAIALLGRVPVLGHLVAIIALLIGIGALVLQVERKSAAA